MLTVIEISSLRPVHSRRAAQLLRFGVTQAFPETIEASLRLGAKALQMAGAPADSVDLPLQGARQTGCELVRENEKGRDGDQEIADLPSCRYGSG